MVILTGIYNNCSTDNMAQELGIIQERSSDVNATHGWCSDLYST